MIRAAFGRRLIGGLRALPRLGPPTVGGDLGGPALSSFSSSAPPRLAEKGVVIDRFTASSQGTEKESSVTEPFVGEDQGSDKADRVATAATTTTTDAPIDDDDDMEQEEMFVEPHKDFAFRTLEWGGPRRGGRLPEPTRYGDWERKGRCTDF